MSHRREQPVVQIGAVFPQLEIGNDRDEIARYARGLREIGYSHILAFDHVLGGSQEAHHPKLVGRYDEHSPFHEVFVLFGYLAGIVPDMELVTGVLVLPQRQTALVAKQASTLDLMTGGKTRIGVGIGWNDIEYQALNEPFGNRARRYVEQIEVLRALWTNDIVTFNGRWHNIDHAGIQPLPIQRPIPIWIGGTAEAAIRRAARIADGFMPNVGVGDSGAQAMAILQDELARTGRDRSAMGIEPRINLANTTPDDWSREIAWWRQYSISHVSINTMKAGYRDIDEHLEALRRAYAAVQG